MARGSRGKSVVRRSRPPSSAPEGGDVRTLARRVPARRGGGGPVPEEGRRPVRTPARGGDPLPWPRARARALARLLVRHVPALSHREAVAVARSLLAGSEGFGPEPPAGGCDPVSGLPVLHDFAGDLLPRLLLRHRRAGRRLALVDVDVVDLGGINGEYGWDAGDAVMREVGARLRRLVRAGDLVLRQPGDRFLCVLLDLADPAPAGAVARRIVEAMEAPVVDGGRVVPVRVRAGVAVFPDHGEDPARLLRAAELAQQAARMDERGGWRVFAADLAGRREGHRLAGELRRALEAGEFVLHFQPQVDLRDGGVVGVEALVRWRHPVRGLVPPAAFLEAAERGGLAVPLGERVLDLALATLARLDARGLAVPRCAVNLGPGMARRPDLPHLVGSLLARHRLAPGRLELELVESVLLDDRDGGVRAWTEALCARGVRLALDDFGTGYASLVHLGRFPVHRLKIDRSFVHDLEGSEPARAVVRAILGLAGGLGLEVVAEGVETEAQRRFLLAHGCRFAQGHLFAPPLPEDELVAFLRTAPATSPGGRNAGR